jgi:hypothetical protein
MKRSIGEKPAVSLLKKIQMRVRYGMTMYSISSILQKIGMEFTPYILYQEGINFMELSELKNISSDYSVELLGPEDMKITGTFKTGFSEKELVTLLNAGGKCIGLKHNGEIAASMWINLIECNYKSTVFHLKNNEAYLWIMYTVESYRGKNLAPFLRYKSYEILKEMGRDVLYSISDYFNSPAVKFKKKLNAKPLKIILFVKLFNKFSWSFTLKSYK